MRSEYTASIELAHQALALQMGQAWAKPAPKRSPLAKLESNGKKPPPWGYILACAVCAVCAYLLSTWANT